MVTPVSAAQANDATMTRTTWAADPRQLPAIRAEARQFLTPLALTQDAKQDLVFAVSEATSNAIEHAYHPAAVGDTVQLRWWAAPHTLWIEIRDHGQWQIPSKQPSGRGFGILLIEQLVGSMAIHHDLYGTRLLLSHPLLPKARALSPTRGGTR